MPVNKVIRSSDSSQAPAVGRAIAILELLSATPAGMRMGEIASKLDLPANSVFRIAGTLEMHGYLVRDNNMRYRLSRKLLSLGFTSLGEDALLEQSSEIMRELRDITKETVSIGIRSDTFVVLIDRIPSVHALKVMSDPGARIDIHASAGGKVLVAFMEPVERETLINRLTLTRYNERTLDTPKKFEAELEKVRTNGYALDLAEKAEGISCVGAPIFNHQGRVIAAIWTTGPSSRLPEPTLPGIARHVMVAANRISERLGFQLSHRKSTSQTER